MALIIQLSCDQCEGSSFTVTIGTPTDARVAGFRDGWLFDGQVDRCPFCTGKNLDYYTEEPF